MSFWAYIITIPALILFALFVPRIVPEAQSQDTEANTNASLLNGKLISYLMLTFIVITAYMIMGIKVPTLMVSTGYGTATDASYVILGLSLGAMLGGATFGRLFAALKNLILPVAMAVMAAVMLLIAVSTSTWLTVLGVLLTGVGVRQFFPWILNAVNADGAGSATGTALILIAYNLAGSLSPYSALLIQRLTGITDLHGMFWINVVLFAILAIIVGALVIFKSRVDEEEA